MGPGQQKGRKRCVCWGKTLEVAKGKQVKSLLQLRQQGCCQLEVCLLRCGRCASMGRNGEPERRMEGWIVHEGEKAVGVTEAAG